MTSVEEFQKSNWNSLRYFQHQSRKIANAYYSAFLELEPQLQAFENAGIGLNQNQINNLIKNHINQKIERDVTVEEFRIAASLIKGLTE